MEPPREKYNSVRNFLDNLGNEKVKICRNCNAVFSYTYETTVLCLSCDFEEEVSTLPSVVEIEDEFEVMEATPVSVDPSPVAVSAIPVAAELDVVESKNEWDMEMDSFEPVEETAAEPADAEEAVVEAAIAEPVPIENTEETAVDAEEAVVEAAVAVEETAVDAEEAVV
ncbi:MAG: hypothetical protein CMB06_01515, partial [Euryarchaeota archaeon]|nr:hypothetical protein [Euryarchaeota archaeon]